VQPRIPRQSTSEQGIHRADSDARLSAELAAVVAGARRRALRDGDRQIDTAHLLHSLLESDPEARAVFDLTCDIFEAAGGKLKGVDRAFDAGVDNGVLVLAFRPRRGNALVSALSITPLAGR